MYDHHLKAGNQGDCVKHPSLVAALDEAIGKNGCPGRMFHYLDLFAGHPWHPLGDGNKYEWRNGIAALSSAGLHENAPESVKCWMSLWHAAPEWPTMTPAGYPGSSWIAAQRCRHAKRPVKLELYDHSEEVRRDLDSAFPASHVIQGANPNICLVGQSLDPTKDKEEHVKAADFVFVDPPGWQSTEHPEHPKWEDILEHVLKPRADGETTLMWMPSAGNNGAFTRKPTDKLKQAADLGYRWSATRWREAGPGTACILVYNRASDKIRKGIEFIADAMKWKKKSFNPVKHS